MTKEVNEQVARAVLNTVDRGLVSGLGNPEPGEMCVEAAVCFAMGEEHGDRPSCVGEAVRAYKVALNDSGWSSSEARAAGMRRVAVAQLGSNIINQGEFARRVAIRNVNTLLAEAFEALNLDATRLRAADDLATAESAARSAAESARSAAESARSAAWSAAWSAARSARSAARSAAWSAAWSAARSARSAAESAAWSAAWSAARSARSAAESAAWSAAESAAESARSAARSAAESARSAAESARSAAESARSAAESADVFLGKAAEMVVQILIEMECPGTKFMFLTESSGAE